MHGLRSGLALSFAMALGLGGQILALNPALAQSPGSAQTPEQFYKGKNLDLEVGYPTGGSNDAYARLVANHLGKHIPGAPSIVPRNVPGAGSFLAVNRVFATLPKDGTVIGLGAPTLALDERLGTQGVRFKTAELNWLGRVDSLINIVMMWKTSPVKTVADAQKIGATLSGTGAGSTVSIYPTVLNNVIGTKFKLVMGYRGSNEAMLAMERGEVEGHSTAWSAVKVAKPGDSGRPPRGAAPRLRRNHEGPGISRRGRKNTARRLAHDRRRGPEAGGASQQPHARAPGEGPRRLPRGRSQLADRFREAGVGGKNCPACRS
jgi:hypothetical protein